jgi:hypothetical protein
VLHALVLAAEALPVGDGAKDAGAEEAVALRLEGAVVDGLGLGDLAMRPGADLLREASWILMASKSMIGPVSSKGLERNIVCVSVSAAGWLRLLNLFRDDFRRIAMPVVLVLVLVFIVVFVLPCFS